MNTQATLIIQQTLSDCLSEPGTIIPKLYRSDGITHNTTVDQLFANLFRDEPYQYIVSTPHENALINIEQYFALHKSEYLAHLTIQHTENIEGLAIHNDSYCISIVLNIINTCIQEHAESVRQEMEEEEDEEVIERIISEYSSYTTFMVILENKLPSLSFIIKSTISESYPNSLWKFLYGRFMEHFYSPLEERLREMLIKGIKELRINAIEKAINKDENNPFDFFIFDNTCKLHEISLILAGKYLNEKSVYFLESTKYTSDMMLDQAMKAQTIELYQQSNKSIDKMSVLIADIKVLQSILIPSQTVKLITHCINTAKTLWNMEEPSHCLFEAYDYKDAEVEMFAQRLRII